MKSEIIDQAQKLLGYRRWYIMISLAGGYDGIGLANHFGVSVATIEKELFFLKQWYGIPSTIQLSVLSAAIEQMNVASVFELDMPKWKSAE